MSHYRTLPTRDAPPVYPVIRITNLSNTSVYLGFKTANANGIWLGPSGGGADYIDAEGLDLTDKRVVDTLKRLVADGTISLTIPAGKTLDDIFPTTTT